MVHIQPGTSSTHWCGAFVNACLVEGGQPSRDWLRYTPSIVAKAKAGAEGLSWHASPKVGDLVLFNWPGGDFVDHVGLVLEVRGGPRADRRGEHLRPRGLPRPVGVDPRLRPSALALTARCSPGAGGPLPAGAKVGGMPSPADPHLASVVRRPLGDAHALRLLVERFDPVLRGVARRHRLSDFDADDVIQETWLAFLEHGGTIREPAAVQGWLATTARRQCLRLLQGRRRERVAEDPARDDQRLGGDPHAALLAAERRAAVLAALAELPLPKRRLMTLLVARPELGYQAVGATLGMPVGSIGPTRLRALSSLRRSTGLRALHA